jgi:hypothetical protein
MEMKDCINNLIHSLLQQGDDIRQRSYGAAPSATKDLTTTTSGDGRATRADAKNQFIWRKKWKWYCLSIQQMSRSQYQKENNTSLYNNISRWGVYCEEEETLLAGKDTVVSCHLKYHSEKAF